MGAIATMLSFINISGGFFVSGKMLDLFKRPNDPKDFFEYYSVPMGLVLGSLAVAALGHIGILENVSGAVA
jgi:NAD(P) transhydrogenase